MSIVQWLLDQLQRGYTYLIGLTDQVMSNVIAAGIVALLGLVWAWLMVRVFRRQRKSKEGEVFDEAFLRRQRKTMLDVVERQWIEGRLERSLHHQAPIFLGLTETPEAVERPWEYEIQTPGQAPRRIRDTSAILDVFDTCGSLLILGAPGSGKTVTLLDLTRQLIDRARKDGDAVLPIVFILASWAQEKKPLDEWMVAEMERQYRVPPALGRYWVKRREVLPMLDGLDEVEESARAACAEAINAYRTKGVGGTAVVICSRETEYAQLSARLKVDGAVTLQPLEDQRLRQHLKRFGKKTATLARMLAEDDQLRELARTPLWLDVMAVAYGGDDTATAPKTVTTSDILDAYIRRVLLEHREPLQEWSPEQCMRSLRWLAQQLERTEQTLFWLEDMQPDWLGGDVEQRRYRWWLRWGTGGLIGLAAGLVVGLVGGLPHGLVVGLISAPILALFSAEVFGLVFGLTGGLDDQWFRSQEDEWVGHFIVATPDLAWDWQSARFGLALGLVVGPVSALFVGLAAGLTIGLGGGLGFGASVWLLDGLLGGLFGGLEPIRKVGRETRPNQGMWRSVRYGLVCGLAFGLVCGPFVGLFAGLLNDSLRFGLVSGLVCGLFAALFVAMTLWGRPAVQHGILRWQLWREGATPNPWRYVAFLEAMTGRLLLDRIGGAYRFKHDLLQKHVAALDDAFIATLASRH